MMIIQLLSIIGVIVATYGYYVEQQIQRDPLYKPLCDVTKRIRCSKTLTSTYARLLGPSNALLGIFFYLVIFLLALFELWTLVFLASVIAFIGSLYLLFLLVTKIKELCLVCTSIYLIDTALLVASTVQVVYF